MSLIPFKPGCISIVGPSRSGKSFLIHSILKERNNMFTPGIKINKILYCYSVYQKEFENLSNHIGDDIIFHQNIPSKEYIEEFVNQNKDFNMIILDDLQNECLDNVDVLKLFTESSHHLDLIVIMSNHNLYSQGRFAKTIQLNSNYLIIFELVRDLGQLRTLASQMYPGKLKSFLKIYSDCCLNTKWGYLTVNLNSNLNDDEHRLYTQILPGQTPIVYKLI